MRLSAYDSDRLGLLSGALADALASARKTIGRQLSEDEVSDLTVTIIRNLMEAHDDGERDPDALQRAAVRSAFGWRAKN